MGGITILQKEHASIEMYTIVIQYSICVHNNGNMHKTETLKNKIISCCIHAVQYWQ